MKKFFMGAFCLLMTLCASAKIDRPKLVVGIVVDQMRWDYLYYYYDQYGEGGIKRLLSEGFSCENNMIPYLPTITAVGHASIFTGTTPALHGIAGNSYLLNGKFTYCVADSTVHGVGTNSNAGKMSPRNMLACTIGDELKIATDFKSKVIGIALKDRAAILPAGHSANAAYWYDSSVGHFITSSYYMDQLPDYVTQFNKRYQTTPGKDMKPTNEGVDLTFKLAETVLDHEKMGQGDVTDMLTVSVSSTDAIGHAFGTRGKENKEVFMELDKDLARFLNTLDQKVGRGNYLLFLTADHGGAHNYNYLRNHKIPAGGFNDDALKKELNSYLESKFQLPNLITEILDYRLYLDHPAIERSGKSLEEIKTALVDYLNQDERFGFAVDFAKAAQSSVPQLIRERIVNGYHPRRSGDVIYTLRPNYYDYLDKPDERGTSHGVWNPYDSHIPLVFMGWHVQHGETSAPTKMIDAAATVCAMLHIQMPNACIGDAILPVMNQTNPIK